MAGDEIEVTVVPTWAHKRRESDAPARFPRGARAAAGLDRDDIQAVIRSCRKCPPPRLSSSPCLWPTESAHRREWLRPADTIELALLQHAQQLALESGASSPTSSRNTVPPVGQLDSSFLLVTAPVNAPRSWPKSSLSSSDSGRAAQLMATKGSARAALLSGSPARPAPCRSRFRR